MHISRKDQTVVLCLLIRSAIFGGRENHLVESKTTQAILYILAYMSTRLLVISDVHVHKVVKSRENR
jgi:hypothetical protein